LAQTSAAISDDAVTARLFPREQPAVKDYYVERDGLRYAGTHLLVDLWGARDLDDPAAIDRTLRACAEASGATVLGGDFHRFQPNGVSGMLLLAESHISIHTWPERGFAALDLFMCGECDPYAGIEVLKRAFEPEQITLTEHKRGMIP